MPCPIYWQNETHTELLTFYFSDKYNVWLIAGSGAGGVMYMTTLKTIRLSSIDLHREMQKNIWTRTQLVVLYWTSRRSDRPIREYIVRSRGTHGKRWLDGKNRHRTTDNNYQKERVLELVTYLCTIFFFPDWIAEQISCREIHVIVRVVLNTLKDMNYKIHHVHLLIPVRRDYLMLQAIFSPALIQILVMLGKILKDNP